jgi:hypothetical protein
MEKDILEAVKHLGISEAPPYTWAQIDSNGSPQTSQPGRDAKAI